MIPTKEVLEKYNPPSSNMWRAVAEALSNGIDYIPLTARAMPYLLAEYWAFVMALIDHFAPKKWKPYMPSAMGLGLAWIMPFANAFSFFIGALIALVWTKINKKTLRTVRNSNCVRRSRRRIFDMCFTGNYRCSFSLNNETLMKASEDANTTQNKRKGIVLKAVDSLGRRVTAADVAAKTGLPVLVAQAELT